MDEPKKSSRSLSTGRRVTAASVHIPKEEAVDGVASGTSGVAISHPTEHEKYDAYGVTRSLINTGVAVALRGVRL